jgi:hypothetical protein
MRLVKRKIQHLITISLFCWSIFTVILIFRRLLKNAPAFGEAPALHKASGGGASRRQADAS